MAMTDDGDAPKNIVAIFHASFHPTKGNIIDWSLLSPSTASSAQPLDLSGVEFSVLPSGLHLVERDVVYFSHGAHAGLAVFRRRPTRAKEHRGFRLASLCVLLETSPRPRPWMHVEALRGLADEVYGRAEKRERATEEEDEDLLGLGAPGDLTDEDFEPARRWFEVRKAIEGRPSVDVWSGWSDELDGNYATRNTPTHHLPHLLRILGLSSLTLYKFVLSRRRVLIYTLPPVEVAGILAWIASDISREHHMSPRNRSLGKPIPTLFEPLQQQQKASAAEDELPPESPTVLGMVTLSDLQRLEHESESGRGWIACTTDAIFMEKPQYYDLIIDLTTSTPSKASRPALYMSKPVTASASGKKRASWKLESVRFTWSDVRLWTELDRILKLDSSQIANHAHAGGCCLPKSVVSGTSFGSSQNAWGEAFRLYEDVCLLCATLWMGMGTWRSNSRESFSTGVNSTNTGGKQSAGAWGAVNVPGDDDWSLEGTHMRTLGMGIEGGPSGPGSGSSSATKRRDKDKDKGKDRYKDPETAKMRTLGLGIEGRPQRSRSGHSRKGSSSSTMMKVTPSQSTSTYIECVDPNANIGEGQDVDRNAMSPEDEEDMRRQNVQTTLALLQTFHANTVFWLSKLREVIPPPSAISTPGGISFDRAVGSQDEAEEGEEETLTITARDLLALELGVLSELDAKFVEWLAEAEGYSDSSSSGSGSGSLLPRARGGRNVRRRRVVVKRGWQELFGIFLGLK